LAAGRHKFDEELRPRQRLTPNPDRHADFVRKQKLPLKVRLELDEKDLFPLDLIRELLGPDIGLHLLFIPEELGGLAATPTTSTESRRRWPSWT